MTKKDILIQQLEAEPTFDVAIRFRQSKLLIDKELFIQLLKDHRVRNSERLKKDAKIVGNSFSEWVKENIRPNPKNKVAFSELRSAYNQQIEDPSQHIGTRDAVRQLKLEFEDQYKDYYGCYHLIGFELEGVPLSPLRKRGSLKPDDLTKDNWREAPTICLRKFLSKKGVKGVYNSDKSTLHEMITDNLDSFFSESN